MGIKVEHLRKYIIEPTLKKLGLYSRDAEELLIATAAHESHLGEYLHQKVGPALGIYQMEPSTHEDIFRNYLYYRKSLLVQIINIATYAEDLMGNLYYATAMARIHYLRVPEKLPRYNDLEEISSYWKIYYNTSKGKGTIMQFIKDYRQYVERG